MKIKELRNQFNKELEGLYPVEEIQSFFGILSERILKLTRYETSVKAEEELAAESGQQFENAISQLKQYKPIQYIIGQTEFYGLPFTVTKDTLIPRPETEELVEWILSQYTNHNSSFTIVDIGTGSGCIAVSLAKHLKEASVSAIDISKEALKVASENAVLNNVEVNFLQKDILLAENLPVSYDIIVSNPPYVRELEKEKMQKNVLDYEPEQALFVSDKDPLVFYRKIARLAKKHLKPNGFLFFEINEYLGEAMKQMLITEGFSELELKKDIFGKDRMLKCTSNDSTF
ncbi:peptide chain release factor N(5)-glutamine methyltransferase [Jejudonia soesokkakensis]|uniref:Release factor glutamine methyltransferase n=1 Tax=Jejudonia soesokkakensis TaxID=1323432 RepID=A0ABW2MY80_9FLAO